MYSAESGSMSEKKLVAPGPGASCFGVRERGEREKGRLKADAKGEDSSFSSSFFFVRSSSSSVGIV